MASRWTKNPTQKLNRYMQWLAALVQQPQTVTRPTGVPADNFSPQFAQRLFETLNQAVQLFDILAQQGHASLCNNFVR